MLFHAQHKAIKGGGGNGAERIDGAEEGIKRGAEEGIKRGAEEGIKRGAEEGIKRRAEEGIKRGAVKMYKIVYKKITECLF